jgi:hypothetical protein
VGLIAPQVELGLVLGRLRFLEVLGEAVLPVIAKPGLTSSNSS